MPLLAALLAGFFPALTAFLIRLFAAKLVMLTVGLGILVSLSVSFVSFFNNTISPLVAQAFNTQYGQFLGLAFPPVAGTCIATILAAVTFVGAYKLKVRYVKMATGMN